MDLLAYALSKKNAGSGGSVEPIIPSIGDNGNWFIKGIDTGFRAIAQENVEVDGILKVNSDNRNISVEKNGKQIVVGEYTTNIELNDINKLFD